MINSVISTSHLRSYCAVIVFLSVLAGCSAIQPAPVDQSAWGGSQVEVNKPVVSMKSAPIIGNDLFFKSTPGFYEDFNYIDSINWRVASWKQNGTQMAKERCQVNEDGFLVQTVLPSPPFRGGSIQTAKEFGYGRWVARLKPSSVKGLLNSFFLKDWDDFATPNVDGDGTQGEVDIEFVTRTFSKNSGEVHIAIHLKGRSRLYERDIRLDFNPSSGFHIWGFDILPDRVVWHVDGRQLHTWMYNETDFINPGYEVFFNSWTWNKWLHGPPKEKGDYYIDWVKFYPLDEGAYSEQ